LEQDFFLLVDMLWIVYYIEPVNERICKIRIKLKYYNLTLISTHAPTEEKDVVAQQEFYSTLRSYVRQFPNTT